MFGTVEASEEAVAQGSPVISKEVRQPSAGPTQTHSEKSDSQNGKSHNFFLLLQTNLVRVG
jgi:hypothetical protein